MERISSTAKLKLTFAVQPIDVCTGLPPAVIPLLTIVAMPVKPLRKPDGVFLLLGVPQGVYTLRLTAPGYGDAEAIVDTGALNPREPVVIVPMLPSAAYRFTPGAAVVRCAVATEAGKPPPPDVRFRAYALDADYAAGKLFKDVSKADGEMVLGAVHRLMSGRAYCLLDKDAKKREIVRVIAVDERTRLARLAEPTRFPHAKGTPIMDVAEGAGNAKGEFAAAFPPQRAKRFPVLAEWVIPDKKPLTLAKEVYLEEGRSVDLGSFPLSDKPGKG